VLLTAASAILLKAGKCMVPRAFLGTYPTDEPISSWLPFTRGNRHGVKNGHVFGMRSTCCSFQKEHPHRLAFEY
jgi:hypothetical protein